MTENLRLSRDGGIMEIAFDRPEKKNALTRAMYAGFVEAMRQADADPTVRALILTGTGDYFTAGNDIGDFQARAATNQPSFGSVFLDTISTLKKPMVAAVNGPAIGVGTTMLAHCDLIVAVPEARFVMPFTSLGLVPEAGSSLLFPNLVGTQRASAMLLLGEPISVEQGLEWGFVNKIAATEALMDVARDYARRLAALPPEAVRQTKKLIRHGQKDIGGRIAEELELFGQRLVSPEAAEAFAAFKEKRKPDFSQFG